MPQWAVLLIDLQSGILDSPKIQWQDAGSRDRVVAAAESIVAASRRSSIPVFHVGVRRPYTRGPFDEPRSQAALNSGQSPRDVLELIAPNDIEFAVRPLPREEVIYKSGVSAFINTSLDGLLRHAGVDHLLTLGVFTHMAIESTVRSGFDLGYQMNVVVEGVCSPSSLLHEASIRAIENFGTCTTVDAAIAGMGGVR